MTKKIFRSIFFTAAVVLCVSFGVVMASLYSYFTGEQTDRLNAELSLAAQGVERDGTTYLEGLPAGEDRITWVAADGTVLFDDQAPAATLENHGEREEIRQALAVGRGSSSRLSTTLMQKTVYEACRLSDGTVLRLSSRQVTPLALILWMFQPILLMVVIAVILSAVLASRMSKQITEPLNHLDLDAPLDNECYEELTPLLRRIHQQRQQIDLQVRTLREKTDEFTQVTSSMGEGLVLLNEKGIVLSINPAAQKIFRFDSSCEGQDFLVLDRSPEMGRGVQAAFARGHGELREEREGREYQFDISRIQSGGTVLGAVVLAFDVTERSQAEKVRQEFTANVSHELKTPLQSIMGSAELMEQGLVSQADMPRFVGHIRTEAARLLSLIEDILRLSQLDEGGDMPRERVELQALTQDVSRELQGKAEARAVTVQVTGEAVETEGVRALLHETIYNLCDNAIKYNVDGGRVELITGRSPDGATVTVRDTGIGIPPEYQERVFERFFRVDKSRSKASGGTGLGLSIVKHAVQYHGGKIDLSSEPGVGTTITVTLPSVC